jgi:hypothetical protein
MDGAIAVGDRDGVVDGLLPGLTDDLARRLVGVGGIARQARTEVRNLAGAVKGAAAIGAAPLVDLDLAPVEAGVFPRLRRRGRCPWR